MEISMQRRRLSEIVKAVKEKEKQGWECVSPIKKIVYQNIIPKYRYSLNKFESYRGECHVVCKYFVKMRKK